jgi:hypothetical protein
MTGRLKSFLRQLDMRVYRDRTCPLMLSRLMFGFWWFLGRGLEISWLEDITVKTVESAFRL